MEGVLVWSEGPDVSVPLGKKETLFKKDRLLSGFARLIGKR